RIQAGEQAEERTLSATGGTHNRGKLAFGDFEVDAFEDVYTMRAGIDGLSEGTNLNQLLLWHSDEETLDIHGRRVRVLLSSGLPATGEPSATTSRAVLHSGYGESGQWGTPHGQPASDRLFWRQPDRRHGVGPGTELPGSPATGSGSPRDPLPGGQFRLKW